MAWFTPLEWSPPAAYPSFHLPVLVWTDVQTFALIWLTDGNICRNNFLADAETDTITDTGFQFWEADVTSNQYVADAAISPSGALLLDIQEDSSG